MRNILKQNYLLIVTFPFGILFIIWFFNTVGNYANSQQLSEVPANALHKKGIESFVFLREKMKHKIAGKSYNPDINIFIKPKKLVSIIEKSEKSKLVSKKATMLINNTTISGKLKPRGDTASHWANKYKSWRFTTNKKKLINGNHKVNFIILKTRNLLNNHLSYKTAKLIDLLSPDSSLVTFSINNEKDTLKLMVEQINENFLRKNKIMPSDIYKGDNFGRKMVNVDGVSLFDNPSLWTKESYNNHYKKNNKKPLVDMIQKLHSDKFDRLDLYEFAKFSAFIDIIGTKHHDTYHNWLVYYDSYKEKMYPIVWDPMGFEFGGGPKDEYSNNIITSLLLESLHRNYKFIKYKHSILFDFYTNKERDFLNMLTREFKIAKEKVDLVNFGIDRKLNYVGYDELIRLLDKYHQDIISRYNKRKILFLSKATEENYKYAFVDNKIRLSIDGDKLIKKVILKLNSEPKISKFKVKFQLNGSDVSQDISVNLDLNEKQIIIPISILSNVKQKLIKYKEYNSTYIKDLSFDEATYDIEGYDVGLVEKIYLEFLSGETIEVNRVDSLEAKSFSNVFDIVDEYKEQTITWSGDISIKGLRTINSDINIKPGTRVILHKDASLIVNGKVSAVGVDNNPILFIAENNKNPWGAIVIKGQKSNGSIFKNCIFQGGSGNKGEFHEYTAMLSIHNVKNVLIDKCKFYDSRVTDDMVHVVYSDVTINNTIFKNSFSDALDADISSLKVNNSQFIDSGNDAIDLMTTDASVTNSVFLNSFDKGISVGESSNISASDNVFKNNKIGVQSKDSSTAYIRNSSFSNNNIAVDLYHKNWRYEKGGSMHVENSVLNGNDKNYVVDKKSSLIIDGNRYEKNDINFELR